MGGEEFALPPELRSANGPRQELLKIRANCPHYADTFSLTQFPNRRSRKEFSPQLGQFRSTLDGPSADWAKAFASRDSYVRLIRWL